jgi:hypothetical protein
MKSSQACFTFVVLESGFELNLTLNSVVRLKPAAIVDMLNRRRSDEQSTSFPEMLGNLGIRPTFWRAGNKAPVRDALSLTADPDPDHDY